MGPMPLGPPPAGPVEAGPTCAIAERSALRH